VPEDTGPGGGTVAPGNPNLTIFGPISYGGYFIYIFEQRPIFDRPVLPGLPNPQTPVWLSQVHTVADYTTDSVFRATGRDYNENLDLCKAWIDSVNLGVTPGTDTDVVEGQLEAQYLTYGECIKIAVDMEMMDFVKSSKEKLARRFQTDSTKSEFFDFGPLPSGFYAKLRMKILSVDDSLPAATRKSNYEEVVKITLEEGDYMSVQSSGNDNISISIMKNGSERIDPFSIMRLRSGYTKTQVTIELNELYDCVKREEPVDDPDDDPVDDERDDDSPVLDKDQMFVILGFLVLIIVGGWILSTTTEGGE
jgi:hypothetical protein